MSTAKQAHKEAGLESKDLCDYLYNGLAQYIPNLNRDQVKRWCGLYEEGRTRFAYVNHRKQLGKIEIWCIGDPDVLQQSTSLEIFPRKQINGAWEACFPSRFFVETLMEAEEACRLLYQVSYQQS
jgi:hypothetical protein